MASSIDNLAWSSAGSDHKAHRRVTAMAGSTRTLSRESSRAIAGIARHPLTCARRSRCN
jgi:hypothetical protein